MRAKILWKVRLGIVGSVSPLEGLHIFIFHFKGSTVETRRTNFQTGSIIYLTFFNGWIKSSKEFRSSWAKIRNPVVSRQNSLDEKPVEGSWRKYNEPVMYTDSLHSCHCGRHDHLNHLSLHSHHARHGRHHPLYSQPPSQDAAATRSANPVAGLPRKAKNRGNTNGISIVVNRISMLTIQFHLVNLDQQQREFVYNPTIRRKTQKILKAQGIAQES